MIPNLTNKPLLATLQQCETALYSEWPVSLPALNTNDARLAILPVHGLLLHRIEGFGTCYETLRMQLREALDSSEVEHIFLDIDSGGGEVNGLFDLVDDIVEARKQKPITALVNDIAYSAAYLIASSASQIVASQTASVGSIGVIVAHCEQSKANKKKGYTFTEVYAGSHKADCSPYQALSPQAKANLQAQVNETYARLIETLARNREKPGAVFQETEANIYSSHAALNLQLIDKIYPPHKCIEELYMNHEQNSLESVLITERERVKEILNISQLAGFPNEAMHWIGAGTPVEDVRKNLFDKMVASTAQPIVNALGDKPSDEHVLMHSMIQGLRG